MEGGFFASLHLYISIAKRPSLTILPDVHMYKAVPSNFRVAFMGAGVQLPKAPKNLGGLLEIEVYFSYLDRIGLLKIVFV
jgi:hypothetical protein